MAGFQITGKVAKIYKTQAVTETFSKREIVLLDDTNPQYPEYVVIQFVKDKCAELDKYKAGDVVTIDFNIKGRAYQKPLEETKYFSSLQGWRISGTGSGTGTAATETKAPETPADDDDLPF